MGVNGTRWSISSSIPMRPPTGGAWWLGAMHGTRTPPSNSSV